MQIYKAENIFKNLNHEPRYPPSCECFNNENYMNKNAEICNMGNFFFLYICLELFLKENAVMNYIMHVTVLFCCQSRSLYLTVQSKFNIAFVHSNVYMMLQT